MMVVGIEQEHSKIDFDAGIGGRLALRAVALTLASVAFEYQKKLTDSRL